MILMISQFFTIAIIGTIDIIDIIWIIIKWR